MPELAETAKKTNAWACYDCGKCTATCPISRIGGNYSPRRHVLATNLGYRQEIVNNGTLFNCLTCSLCDLRCPAEVRYTQLIQQLRELSFHEGVEPECPHCHQGIKDEGDWKLIDVLKTQRVRFALEPAA